MITLYLMCGAPGSGKSTYIKNNKTENDAVISRDIIRFSLVKENEEYFSKENLVFNTFINEINKAIKTGFPAIYIDATHLNEKARNKVLDKLHLSTELKIVPIYFDISLEKCLEQNNMREGRMRVPDTVIKNMYNSIQPPTYSEKYKYFDIITIKE